VNLHTPFSLEEAINLEPFLFFYEDGKMERVLRYKGSLIKAEFSQKSEKTINVKLDLISGEKDDLLEVLQRLKFCLGVDEDLHDFLKMVEKSDFLNRYFDVVKNIRIFSAFDEFEACACIILSQNTSYTFYRKNVQKLLDLNNGVFPLPRELPSLIDSVPVGYRKRYLIDLARFFEGKDFFRALKPEEIKVKGFGQYSKDIYVLFQHRNFGNVYLDRLTEKIFQKHLGLSNKEVKDYLNKEFPGYEGLVIYIVQLLHRFKLL